MISHLARTTSSEFVGLSPITPPAPAPAHPPMMASKYCSSDSPLPNVTTLPPIVAECAGKESFCPKMVVEVSGFGIVGPSRTDLMLTRTRWSALKLFRNAAPDPTPPNPGKSPAQATPSHSGQTRHSGYRASRAFVYTDFTVS